MRPSYQSFSRSFQHGVAASARGAWTAAPNAAAATNAVMIVTFRNGCARRRGIDGRELVRTGLALFFGGGAGDGSLWWLGGGAAVAIVVALATRGLPRGFVALAPFA